MRTGRYPGEVCLIEQIITVCKNKFPSSWRTNSQKRFRRLLTQARFQKQNFRTKVRLSVNGYFDHLASLRPSAGTDPTRPLLYSCPFRSALWSVWSTFPPRQCSGFRTIVGSDRLFVSRIFGCYLDGIRCHLDRIPNGGPTSEHLQPMWSSWSLYRKVWSCVMSIK